MTASEQQAVVAYVATISKVAKTLPLSEAAVFLRGALIAADNGDLLGAEIQALREAYGHMQIAIADLDRQLPLPLQDGNHSN